MFTNSPVVEKIKDFKTFFGFARKRKSHDFSLYYVKGAASPTENNKVPNPKASPQIRFGVIASKKGVSKKAVHRNRVKRRLRAAFSIALKSTQSPANCDVQLVFFANRAVLKSKWENLTESVAHAMQAVLEERPK